MISRKKKKQGDLQGGKKKHRPTGTMLKEDIQPADRVLKKRGGGKVGNGGKGGLKVRVKTRHTEEMKKHKKGDPNLRYKKGGSGMGK